MPVTLTEEHKKLIEDPRVFAHVATVNKDGSPTVNPVWVDHDGTHIILNSEQKRRKVRNMKRSPRISVEMMNPDNAYNYVEFRGRVVDITPEGAFDHIDKMAKKYMGQDKYPYNKPDDVRVLIKVAVDSVSGMGR